jgi:hypothetical protein
MKICYKCKESKSLSDFYKDRTRLDGHNNCCKSCSAEREKLRVRTDHTYHQTNWKNRNLEKYEAHKKVKNGLRANIISKTACFVCGDSKVEAHHPDYSRPLDVIWMCRTHHRATHKTI